LTVLHRKKIFDTAILRPYGMTKRICGCYYGDECEIGIVSGMPEGIGKSGYVNHVLADTDGYQSFQPCQGRVVQERGMHA